MDLDASNGNNGGRRHVIVVGLAGIALLSALVWHAVGAAAWERPLIVAAERLDLPGSKVWILAWQPAAFVVETLALACVAAGRGRPKLAVAGASGCLVAVATAEWILKPLVDRRRPDHVVSTFRAVNHVLAGSYDAIPRVHPGSIMFPSAHVTAAAAWATFAWLVFAPSARWASRLLAALPLATAWTVVATRMHYPADAAAGLFVGPVVVLATVVAVGSLLEPLEPQRRTVDVR